METLQHSHADTITFIKPCDLDLDLETDYRFHAIHHPVNF